jgi:ABC-2 type transport system permease protein
MAGAVRAGLARGWIEIRHSLADSQEWIYNVSLTGILVGVLFFQRDSTVDGTTLPLATLTLPSLVGMLVAYGGLLGAATALAYDREDGTLLRAKATPYGTVGYLVSRIVLATASVVVLLVLLFAAGGIFVDGFAVSAGGWLTVLWVLALGLLATLPWGAIVGARVRTATSSAGITMLIIGGLVSISGIFYPITALPGWLQGVAQAFPMYWLGLGMRAALLPDAAAAAELSGSWRLWQVAGVLSAWAVVGLLLAPAILRRMARGEAGSAVQAHRQRILQRGY